MWEEYYKSDNGNCSIHKKQGEHKLILQNLDMISLRNYETKKDMLCDAEAFILVSKLFKDI